MPKESSAQIGVACDYQDPDFPCPIDDGVYVLVAIAVLYGTGKVREQKNEATGKKNLG